TPSAHLPLLDDLGKRAQERLLLANVCREVQANLRRMEQVLDAFFRDQNKRAELATLAVESRQVRGALAMLGFAEAEALLAMCQEQIDRYVSSRAPVADDELEMLAEALSCLGFYIEAVEQRRPDPERLIAPLLARRIAAVAPAAIELPAEELVDATEEP